MFDQQYAILLKPEKFQLYATITSTLFDSIFLNHVCDVTINDALVLDIKRCHDENIDKFKFEDNLMYFEECLYIQEGPMRLHIL